jgi:hypothetical protein
MTRRQTVFATLGLMMVHPGGGRIYAQESLECNPIVLPASVAKVTGALKIQGKSDMATIHFWNNSRDLKAIFYSIRVLSANSHMRQFIWTMF